jgi:predicted dehydrogenase
MLDVALIGCGYMGQHHARTIAAHPSCRLVAVVDLLADRSRYVAQATGATAMRSVPAHVDAVVVATPTDTHAQLAAQALAQGQWCLVEKPLTDSTEAMAGLCSPRLVVGHVERFNPAVRAAGVLHPHFVQTQRLCPPSPRGRDVDVVLDLLIHDLDLFCLWAAQVEIEVVDAAGVVGDDGWDVASVRLRSSLGLTGSLMVSRVADVQKRTADVYEPGRHVALDLLNGTARSDDCGPLPGDGQGDALGAQWRAFVAAACGKDSPAPRGLEATRALELADRVRQSLRRS